MHLVLLTDGLLGYFESRRVQIDRNHEQRGHGPCGEADEFSDEWRSIPRRRNRMTHGYVAIGGHNGQQKRRSELVDRRRCHVDLQTESNLSQSFSQSRAHFPLLGGYGWTLGAVALGQHGAVGDSRLHAFFPRSSDRLPLLLRKRHNDK